MPYAESMAAEGQPGQREITGIWTSGARVTAHVRVAGIREELRYSWLGPVEGKGVICVIPAKSRRGRSKGRSLNDLSEGDLRRLLADVAVAVFNRAGGNSGT